MKVIETFQGNPAFITLGDFFNVIFETFEGRELPIKDHDVVAHKPHAMLPRDPTLDHDRAANIPDS